MKITDQQKKKLEKIGKKYNLNLILLHGSYATAKQHLGSDLDIAYLPSKQLTLRQQLALHSSIAKIFGDTRKRELDLKSLSRTDPLFQYEVAQGSQLLYGSRDVYDEFCAYAFRRYHDHKDIFSLEDILLSRLHKRLMQKHA